MLMGKKGMKFGSICQEPLIRESKEKPALTHKKADTTRQSVPLLVRPTQFAFDLVRPGLPLMFECIAHSG
jgi:hypothetical protein